MGYNKKVMLHYTLYVRNVYIHLHISVAPSSTYYCIDIEVVIN